MKILVGVLCVFFPLWMLFSWIVWSIGEDGTGKTFWDIAISTFIVMAAITAGTAMFFFGASIFIRALPNPMG